MSTSPRLRLALAGGGTGGHVVPGLHLLAHLEVLESDGLEDLLWLGAGRAVEDRVLADLGERVGSATWERVALKLEPPGGGAPSLGGLSLRIVPSVAAARRALKRHRSQVLLGLGGFTTVPAVLAARSLRIPVLLLEINAVPGRATKWLSRFAAKVFHAWPATLPKSDGPAAEKVQRHVHTGPPLSPALAATVREVDESDARRRLGVAPDRPMLLVLGGSQGALGLNRFVASEARTLLSAGVTVLHQVGPGRLAEAAPAQDGYAAVEYIDDVPLALRAAAFVLCRGGASTIAEVGALARPAWVVPYPHHPDRHQELNARMLGEGVRIVTEGDLSEARAGELVQLLSEAGEAERERMSRALVRAVPTDGAERIASDMLALASRSDRSQ